MFWIVGVRWTFGEKIDFNSLASGLSDWEVGGVGMDGQLHPTCYVFDFCLWIWGKLVQELSQLFCSVSCGFGLPWGNFSKGRENSVIDSNGIIIKIVTHLLHEVSLFIWEILCCVQTFHILDLLSIRDWGTGIWRVILASSQYKLESVQCLVHITWHRKFDGSVHIVPREFNPNVYCLFHVDCDEVFGSEGV